MTSNNDNDNDDEVYDDTPSFIDMDSAVEVQFPEDVDVEPMDEESTTGATETAAATEDSVVVDMSRATFDSHTEAVYAVCAHFDAASQVLAVASGGGDDRAYLHLIPHLIEPSTTTNSSSPSKRTILLSHKHKDSVSCLAFNTPFIHNDVSGIPQMNLLAVGSYDGTIALYDASDGNMLKLLEGPTDFEWCCFHPKGGTVLLAGSISDGTIWMYHIPSSQCLQVFVGHENGGVTSGAFTPDGKWVVSAGQDGTLRVWAPKTGMSRHVFRLLDASKPNHMVEEEEGPSGGAGLTCLAVGGGQDGQLAIAGGEDGNAYVVHISGKKLIATLPHFDCHSMTPISSQNENDLEGQGGIEEEESRSVEAVGFCPPNIPGTAHWCATGGVDGVLKIWNLNVGGSTGAAQLRHCCRREEGKAGITRLKWHCALPIVLASYTDGCICIWDVRVGKIVELLTGHEDMINDMDVCYKDDNVAAVVTGSDDKSVKIFEFHPNR